VSLKPSIARPSRGTNVFVCRVKIDDVVTDESNVAGSDSLVRLGERFAVGVCAVWNRILYQRDAEARERVEDVVVEDSLVEVVGGILCVHSRDSVMSASRSVIDVVLLKRHRQCSIRSPVLSAVDLSHLCRKHRLRTPIDIGLWTVKAPEGGLDGHGDLVPVPHAGGAHVSS
jgi:hypothetical protein